MSLREEQCKKVCRILDDVLANRPTERDALIVAVRTAFDELEERKRGRWIPCSEQLPFAEYGESDKVLATCGHIDGEDTSVRWIRELYYNGGNWCYPTGETYDQKVYAWMPLPEPYREGES